MKDYVNKIVGYDRLVYQFGKGYVHTVGHFIVTIEYWSIWYKNGRRKLKKTLLPPHKKIDSYGWCLLSVYEQLTLVRRDRVTIIYL